MSNSCQERERLAPQGKDLGTKARSGLVTSKAVVSVAMVHQQLLMNKIKTMDRSSLDLTPNLSMKEGTLTMLSS